jgi:hypothetical protein
MRNSPRTARWIDMAADPGYDLHLSPVEPGPPHHKLRNLTLYIPVPDELGRYKEVSRNSELVPQI